MMQYVTTVLIVFFCVSLNKMYLVYMRVGPQYVHWFFSQGCVHFIKVDLSQLSML